MRMTFLGTGASEAVPAMFCTCRYCTRARAQGGKDIRTRSSFRIDDRHQIDYGPDCLQQILRHGMHNGDLEHLLVTHSHEDHFDLPQILSREHAVPVPSRPLSLYMHHRAAEWAQRLLSRYVPEKKKRRFIEKRYRLVRVNFFETFRAGNLEVTALKANHGGYGKRERGLNYLIRLEDGFSFLYGTDTGWYAQETWRALEGRRADAVILDATFGGRMDRGEHPDGHLDLRSMLLMFEGMARIGFIDESTALYATHMNHKHDLLHDDMQRALDASTFKVTVAYDGLSVPVDRRVCRPNRSDHDTRQHRE